MGVGEGCVGGNEGVVWGEIWGWCMVETTEEMGLKKPLFKGFCHAPGMHFFNPCYTDKNADFCKICAEV